jgi:hypothetical protein
MSPQKQNSLYSIFPKIFSEHDNPDSCMKYGISCDDGWYQIIFDLCRSIQNLTDSQNAEQTIAEQVKEKFGGLRFYTKNSRTIDAHKIIIAAERKSFVTCEVCGETGVLHKQKDGALLKTVCQSHAKELNLLPFQ